MEVCGMGNTMHGTIEDGAGREMGRHIERVVVAGDRPGPCTAVHAEKVDNSSRQARTQPSRPPAHLRALLGRQREGLAELQQRLLPPGRLPGQQVSRQLSVHHSRVQRVGCMHGHAVAQALVAWHAAWRCKCASCRRCTPTAAQLPLLQPTQAPASGSTHQPLPLTRAIGADRQPPRQLIREQHIGQLALAVGPP